MAGTLSTGLDTSLCKRLRERWSKDPGRLRLRGCLPEAGTSLHRYAGVLQLDGAIHDGGHVEEQQRLILVPASRQIWAREPPLARPDSATLYSKSNRP